MAARMALALAKTDVPFALSHADEVLAALKGTDLVEVGPFYRQLSIAELEEAHPGAARQVTWDAPPTLRLRREASVVRGRHPDLR
jgi:hypothetical protein